MIALFARGYADIYEHTDLLVELFIGEDTTLICNSSSTLPLYWVYGNRRKILFKWPIFNSTHSPSNVHIDDSHIRFTSLSITDAVESNTGEYYCFERQDGPNSFINFYVSVSKRSFKLYSTPTGARCETDYVDSFAEWKYYSPSNPPKPFVLSKEGWYPDIRFKDVKFYSTRQGIYDIELPNNTVGYIECREHRFTIL